MTLRACAMVRSAHAHALRMRMRSPQRMHMPILFMNTLVIMMI
jgi:hypothetical protein